MKIEFENHIPDYCDPRGCKREHLYFDSLDELLEAKKEWLIDKNHKDLIFSCGTYNTLMISSQSEEWWWVIGYVNGIDLSKNLPRFDEVYIKPKMSKELEELKIIRQSINDMLDKNISMDGDIAISLEKRLDIIEYALKEHEEYKQILNDYGLSLADFRHACFTFAQFKNSKGFEGVEKKLKALEIIEDKPLTLHLISKCADYDEYLFVVSRIIDAYQFGYVYSKEEFDLLKEALYE